eukprot:GHVP01070704.1.p1 GENE.GHVP01070704.1~~GHVP01070704.1.p1  ORF type:complete len:290 (+),score=52.08 GHVP01070704.1:131-1000(+)
MREGFSTIPDVSWEDIGSLGAEKQELITRICNPIRDKRLYNAMNMEAPAGILLYGEPGCGKTLLAKAAANDSQANFIAINGPELLNKYVGESERAVRKVFERARLSEPCIVFFDELDALCPTRGLDGGSVVTDRVVNQMLTELDGVRGRSGIFVIGATNRKDIVDPALLRGGRIESHVEIKKPDEQGRKHILDTLLKQTPCDPDLDLSKIAARTDGKTGADLAALVRSSKLQAIEEFKIEILKNQQQPKSEPDRLALQKMFEVADVANLKLRTQHFFSVLKKVEVASEK